jgi:hypothetical protein
MKRILFLTFAALTFSFAVAAQDKVDTRSKAASTSTALMPLAEVHAGQRGVARTVFAGSETQEFGVEVLGVIPGFPAPRQSAIIARLAGANVDRTGVFAGMSGSPVFIDGKLVGAIAFAFPFAKEPIAGITPIEQMIDIFQKSQVSSPKSQVLNRTSQTEGADVENRSLRRFTVAQLSGADAKFNLPQTSVNGVPFLAPVAANSPLAALLGQQIAPIATPLVFGGISQEAINAFAPQLQARGLLPVSGMTNAGGAAEITPMAKVTDKTLLPGSSVSVELVRGDYSIAASGTVTFRDGEKIYAFGHPFLGLGIADMPMAESSVVTVIPNQMNSFKLAVPGALVGSISQDRATGIYGQLGRAPKMIPVKINLHTSRERDEKFQYEVVNDKFLTPLLLNLTVFSTLSASERSLGDSTIALRGTINIKGQPQIKIERRFSSQNAGLLAAGSIAAPISALLSSGFDDLDIAGVNLDIASLDARQSATLERIALNRAEIERGGTIEIQAYIRNDAGRQFVERIPVEIPSDVPPGQLILFVGDGGSLQQATQAQDITPRDLSQLVSAINKIKKNDRLYVKIFRVANGAMIGTTELPDLPPSVFATLNSERTAGGFTATALAPIYEKELPPAEYVINGQQLIGITVK